MGKLNATITLIALCLVGAPARSGSPYAGIGELVRDAFVVTLFSEEELCSGAVNLNTSYPPDDRSSRTALQLKLPTKGKSPWKSCSDYSFYSYDQYASLARELKTLPGWQAWDAPVSTFFTVRTGFFSQSLKGLEGSVAIKRESFDVTKIVSLDAKKIRKETIEKVKLFRAIQGFNNGLDFNIESFFSRDFEIVQKHICDGFIVVWIRVGR